MRLYRPLVSTSYILRATRPISRGSESCLKSYASLVSPRPRTRLGYLRVPVVALFPIYLVRGIPRGVVLGIRRKAVSTVLVVLGDTLTTRLLL